MNKKTESENFVAASFGDNKGSLMQDNVRYIRNFVDYYQNTFSLLSNDQVQSYDFIRAGHHGSWKTIFASSRFFANLFAKESETRAKEICQWFTAQGWAKFEVLRYNNDLASYQVSSASMSVLEKYFLQGIILSVHLVSRLQTIPEVDLDYLEKVLTNSLSLVQEQNHSNEENSIYEFIIP